MGCGSHRQALRLVFTAAVICMHCREMQGVKVRLEVGPKEAQDGGCILSISTKPGEVAAKTPLPARLRLDGAVEFD